MSRTKLAWIWAAAILVAAMAARFGDLDGGAATALYIALLVSAVVSLRQARCSGC